VWRDHEVLRARKGIRVIEVLRATEGWWVPRGHRGQKEKKAIRAIKDLKDPRGQRETRQTQIGCNSLRTAFPD
jgi:hypothetical protein